MSTEVEKRDRLSDRDIEQLQRARFQERVQRVLAVMREERIDWKGLPFITSEGRIAVRVLPVEGCQQ